MASPIPSFSDSIPLPAGEDLSIEDARKALDAIVEMARCKHIDTRAEAAKIFCDLSLQQSMHALLCDSGCILVLVELLQLDHDCCKQHAACALANLSSSRPCQVSLIVFSLAVFLHCTIVSSQLLISNPPPGSSP